MEISWTHGLTWQGNVSVPPILVYSLIGIFKRFATLAWQMAFALSLFMGINDFPLERVYPVYFEFHHISRLLLQTESEPGFSAWSLACRMVGLPKLGA